MMNIYVMLAGVCSFSSLIRAMIITEYKRTPVPVLSDVSDCGISASSIDYCAARVTSDTCKPLTRDWCETKDMSMSGSYLIKRTIKHVPEETRIVGQFARRVPMNMTVGSEVEMKFAVRNGWQGFRNNYLDNSGNAVFSAMVMSNKINFGWKQLAVGVWQNISDILINHAVHNEYTLTMRCDVSSFRVYRNGVYILTYNTTLPVASVETVTINFMDGTGDLLWLSFKVGQ